MKLIGMEALQLHSFFNRQAPRSVSGLFNQNFGTIFVIASRNCPRYFIIPQWPRVQTVSKAIPGLCMVSLMPFQRIPGSLTQRISFQHRFDNTRKFRILVRFSRFLRNTYIFFCYRHLLRVKPHYIESFTMLRHPIGSINNLPIDNIPEFVFQRTTNYLKCSTFVMGKQILYIFQHERLGTLQTQNLLYLKEKSTLRFILKPMLSSQRIFLGDSGKRKWLTRESGTQNIMVRNQIFWYFPYISVWDFAIITGIRLFGIFIPFTGKNAFPSGILKGYTKAANTGKQIYKRKFPELRRSKRQFRKQRRQ